MNQMQIDEEELCKKLSEKLLSVIPDEMINAIVNFSVQENSTLLVVNFTNSEGVLRTHTYKEDQLNKQKINEVNRFIEKKLLEIRKNTDDYWDSCMFWVNREGKFDINFYC